MSPLRCHLRQLRGQAAVVCACHARASGRRRQSIACGVTATRAHPPTSDRFASRFGCRVIDGFGSTEGGIAIGRTPDTPAGALGPLPDEVQIVDVDTGQPCPVWRGRRVGQRRRRGRFEGYYNDPEANAQRMAGGVYHSGDLAYRDEAGYAYFAGRLGDWLRVDGENLRDRADRAGAGALSGRDGGGGVRGAGPAVGDQVMAALVLAPGGEFDADKFARSSPSRPTSGPSSGRRNVRSARVCHEPRPSRCSSGNCRPRASTAPIRYSPIPGRCREPTG